MRQVLRLSILTAILASGCVRDAAAATRPNIVVILSDDMGYSDLGCYGGELATPNLDALAAGGVRFTQFYNNARCCPTRASLLTGLYPHQAGVGHMMEDRGYDGYRGVLNRQSVTIPEVLRPSGYRTYLCGKWHVTRFAGEKADRATWPLGRGFEKFYGTIAGGGSFYDPTTLCRGNTLITPVNDPEYRPSSYYYTDAISDNAVKFLAEHRKESPEKPFFLYVAYTAAHWPMHAPEAAIARYKGRFDGGYAPDREARLRRMKEIGLVPPDTPLSPGSDDWSAVADKAWESRCKEVYAAMVEVMDAGIGRIVGQLKADGQLDNTLILFLQDNGACAEDTGRKPNGDGPGDLKPMGPDQLQPRVNPPMQTRDGRWVRSGPGVMPGPADTYVAYGRGWANVSNTPFREYKHWTHEGGISTPLIAHWPAGIRRDRAGQLERQPGHLIDLMATCADLAGATYPTEVNGKAIKPREGVSLRPALNGEPLARAQPLFWEHEGNRAVRIGDWKLVAKEGKPWSLYNIAADRTESRDLAVSEPSRAKAMAAAWDAWAARANVLPLGAWREKDSESVPVNRRRQFALKPGEHLDRAEAPAVANRPFSIEAVFEASDGHPDGVIVAQGGTAHGYTLFLKAGEPCFLVRSADGVHRIVGPKLSPGMHTITARLDAAGTLSLGVDGKLAEPVPGGLLARTPRDGLDVGRDAGPAVGPYASPHPYRGAIRSVTIAVGDAPATPAPRTDADAARPNVILVLADDFGWGDLSCYNPDALAKTPHLDRMAKEGVRFTQFYVASPICSPSRCGIITGQWPGRWRINSYLQTRAGNAACEMADFLDPKAPSLPRVLKEAGYATAHVGKWHLGGGRDVVNPPRFAAYGYDRGLGTYESPEPAPEITATDWIWSDKDPTRRWDRTSWMVDRTLDFLRENPDKPCFVNLWLDDTHTPWVPSADDQAVGKGGRTVGKPDTPERFARVLTAMDAQLGRLLDALRDRKSSRPTVVLFLGDNGPLPTFGQRRAGGLRGSKLSLYEGGIRTPCLAWGPGVVPAGVTNEATVLAAEDLLPTLADLCGARPPDGYAPDGEDLVAALRGESPRRSKPLFWEYGRNATSFAYPGGRNRSPNVAVRDGDLKLLVNADGSGAQLYDLAADPKEAHDLAASRPEAARALADRALAWRRSLP